MKFYESGNWGFSLICGLEASVFPRSFVIALPNAIATFIFASMLENDVRQPDSKDKGYDTTDNALKLLAGFTSVMFFILSFRSNIAYSRWWEGGTLLQKTRGEWFNAYSSLMAFTSTDPKHEKAVEEFQHLLCRLMSLLFCCGLQQVSPCKDRAFEVLDLEGIDPLSLGFLNDATDKVEVILQWIQRATVLHMQTGVLPVAPPVLSRAFQEVSRGIVNLQNARKIADFPFPFPYAQASMVLLLVHWCSTPVVCSMLFSGYVWHRTLAASVSFGVIFSLWCINFIALQLESPFGERSNDLPMTQMQLDWNNSLRVLLAKRAQRPPDFVFDPALHTQLNMMMSDGTMPKIRNRYISLNTEASHEKRKSRRSTFVTSGGRQSELAGVKLGQQPAKTLEVQQQILPQVASAPSATAAEGPKRNQQSSTASGDFSSEASLSQSMSNRVSAVKFLGVQGEVSPVASECPGSSVTHGSEHLSDDPINEPRPSSRLEHQVESGPGRGNVVAEAVQRASDAAQRAVIGKDARHILTQRASPSKDAKHIETTADVSRRAWELQLSDVGVRMKELHSTLIDEELALLASLARNFSQWQPLVEPCKRKL